MTLVVPPNRTTIQNIMSPQIMWPIQHNRVDKTLDGSATTQAYVLQERKADGLVGSSGSARESE